MKTEFLIPFEIDTSVVEARIESEGYDTVVQKLTDEFREKAESSLPYRFGRVDWERAAWNAIDKFIGSHADEIVDVAAELLARKAGNKKRWREVLDEIKRERKED